MSPEDFQKMVLTDLKEIRKELGKTCVELVEQKNALNNHLNSIKNKAKSKKDKTHLVITIISLAIASIAVLSTIFR